MKRASDEWQSPQFHHRTVDTASKLTEKKGNRARARQIVKTFQNFQGSHTYHSNEPIEAGRAVSKERTCSEPTAIHLQEGIKKQLNFQFTI